MRIKPFDLERYFAKYEFSASYLLCSSDCETLTQKELLSMADVEMKTKWEELSLGYTEPRGHPLLRTEISKLYNKITIDDVLVLTPEEGILISMHMILEKGDNVIVSFPGYQSLYELAESIGATVTQWKPNNNYEFDPSKLKELVASNTKLIVINFPHNPTGATLTVSQQDDIISIAKEQKIPIFSDEMYKFLEHDPSTRLEAMCDKYSHGISLFGMSKSFGLAGLRIGWLATQDKSLMEKFTTYKDYTTICSSAPSELLAIIALRAKSTILSRTLEIVNKNLSILDAFFEKYKDLFTWHKPNAGPIGFPQLRKGSAFEFCEDLVAKKGVMILPSSVYGYEVQAFRIGFGRRNMPEALKLFEEYLTNH
jgi:aspartate/methionine/tyrosine aminotransferase